MNLNQIVNMITRIFLRKIIHLGVNKGIDLAAGKGKSKAQMTGAEHKQAQDARAAVKRARQAARMTKRLGR